MNELQSLHTAADFTSYFLFYCEGETHSHHAVVQSSTAEGLVDHGGAGSDLLISQNIDESQSAAVILHSFIEIRAEFFCCWTKVRRDDTVTPKIQYFTYCTFKLTWRNSLLIFFKSENK